MRHSKNATEYQESISTYGNISGKVQIKGTNEGKNKSLWGNTEVVIVGTLYKLERDTIVVLGVQSVAALASVNLARPSFASNIPSTFNFGAVLSLA